MLQGKLRCGMQTVSLSSFTKFLLAVHFLLSEIIITLLFHVHVIVASFNFMLTRMQRPKLAGLH